MGVEEGMEVGNRRLELGSEDGKKEEEKREESRGGGGGGENSS